MGTSQDRTGQDKTMQTEDFVLRDDAQILQEGTIQTKDFVGENHKVHAEDCNSTEWALVRPCLWSTLIKLNH